MDLKVSLTYDRDATTTLDFLVAPGSTLKELAICLPRLPRQGRWRGGKWEGGSTLRIMYKNQYAKNYSYCLFTGTTNERLQEHLVQVVVKFS